MRCTAIQAYAPQRPGPVPFPAREATVSRQLDALLIDAGFHRLIGLVAAETMRAWHVPRRTAIGLVMSAVGDPRTLEALHREWFTSKAAGCGAGLARVIMRRRVLDLLRSDARRPLHASLPWTSDELDNELGARDERIDCDPLAQIEINEIVMQVRSALRCFSHQGHHQKRQAWLVERYALDEVDPTVLAKQLACSQPALRVRIHKAMRALRHYIETRHPALRELVDGGAQATDRCSPRVAA